MIIVLDYDGRRNIFCDVEKMKHVKRKRNVKSFVKDWRSTSKVKRFFGEFRNSFLSRKKKYKTKRWNENENEKMRRSIFITGWHVFFSLQFLTHEKEILKTQKKAEDEMIFCCFKTSSNSKKKSNFLFALFCHVNVVFGMNMRADHLRDLQHCGIRWNFMDD